MDNRYHTACVRALQALQQRLPQLSSLNAKLKLSLGGAADSVSNAPTVLIDACEDGPARLTLVNDGGAEATDWDCHTRIDPFVLLRFINGQSEVRFAAIDASRMKSEGHEAVALLFGDILSGRSVEYPSCIDTTKETLPVPTEDLDQVLRDVEKWGYGFIANALKPDQLKTLQQRTNGQAQAEMEQGVSVHDGGPTLPNQRVYNLVSKGQEFIDLLHHPIIDKLVPEILNDDFLLYSYSANIAKPGGKPMVVHTDQLTIQPPHRSFPFGFNIMWFLTDVTEGNGGTRVWPGSHRPACAVKDLRDVEGSIFASGPAGTAMVFESRLWHATGAYSDQTGSRPVLLSFFVRSFLRTQENWFLQVPPEVLEGLDDRVKAMLGYKCAKGLGQVMGGRETGGRPSPAGSITSHPKEYIARLEPMA